MVLGDPWGLRILSNRGIQEILEVQSNRVVLLVPLVRISVALVVAVEEVGDNTGNTA